MSASVKMLYKCCFGPCFGFLCSIWAAIQASIKFVRVSFDFQCRKVRSGLYYFWRLGCTIPERMLSSSLSSSVTSIGFARISAAILPIGAWSNLTRLPSLLPHDRQPFVDQRFEQPLELHWLTSNKRGCHFGQLFADLPQPRLYRRIVSLGV